MTGIIMDDIPVLKEIPAEARPVGGAVPRMATAVSRTYYHHCDACGGWIAGLPTDHDVEPSSDPQGRRGVEFRCARCHRVLGFRGDP